MAAKPTWVPAGAHPHRAAEKTARKNQDKKAVGMEKSLEQRKKEREARSKPWEQKKKAEKKEEEKKPIGSVEDLKERLRKMQEKVLVRANSAVSLMSKLTIQDDAACSEEEAGSTNWEVLGESDEEEMGSAGENWEVLGDSDKEELGSAGGNWEILGGSDDEEEVGSPVSMVSSVVRRTPEPRGRRVVGGRFAVGGILSPHRPETPGCRVDDMEVLMAEWEAAGIAEAKREKEEKEAGLAREIEPMTPDSDDGRPMLDPFNVDYEYTADRTRGRFEPGNILRRRGIWEEFESVPFAMGRFQEVERCGTPVIEEEEDEEEVLEDPWGDCPEDLEREWVRYSEQLWPERLRM